MKRRTSAFTIQGREKDGQSSRDSCCTCEDEQGGSNLKDESREQTTISKPQANKKETKWGRRVDTIYDSKKQRAIRQHGDKLWLWLCVWMRV